MRFPSWARSRPILVRVLLALALFEAFYFVAANGFLASKLLEKWISSSDGTLKLRYHNVFTPFPGRYRVTGLEISRRSESAQFRLQVPDAWFTCNPIWLLQKRFVVTRVRGEGVTFRLRVPPTEAEMGGAAALAQPPIADFDATQWPPVPLVVDPPNERWTVDISGVEVSASELWFDRLRYRGASVARGKFILTPSAGFNVGPATLDILSGQIDVGERIAAATVEAHIDCFIDTMPLPIQDNAMDVLRRVDSRITLRADLQSASFVDAYMPQLKVEDGSGLVWGELGVKRGVVTAGSRGGYETYRVVVATAFEGERFVAESPLSALWEASETGSVLAAETPALRVGREGAAGYGLTLSQVNAAVSTTVVDLPGSVSLAGTRASVESFEAPDVRFFNVKPLAAAGVTLEGGSAKGGGDFTLSGQGSFGGSARLDLQRFAGRMKTNALAADLTLTARAGDSPLAKGIALETARLELRNVALQVGKRAVASGWWGRFDTGPSAIGFSPSGSFAGPVHLRAKDAKPFMELAFADAKFPTWLLRHLSTDALVVQSSVAVSKDRFDLNIPAVDAGPYGMSGHLRIDPRDQTCAAFLFTERGEQDSNTLLSLGVALKRSGTELKPTADKSWLDERIKEMALRSSVLCAQGW